ncbi:hypothetical protein [Streptomyces sp. NPDC002889]|uniref:hypothetical protein n=1 Tax=Streptomyces sp. NPDC002889 TaxID=3364669 RepID=UPI0036CE32B9
MEAADEKLLRLRQEAARRGQCTQLPAVTRVLFLSFSRTAVAQIIDRAANVIGELRPRLEVSTFHGFAWRVITGFGAHHGYPPRRACSVRPTRPCLGLSRTDVQSTDAGRPPAAGP